MNFPVFENAMVATAGLIVAATSFVALKNDWNASGVANQVFKVMLALLCLGAVIATLASTGILGAFPKAS